MAPSLIVASRCSLLLGPRPSFANFRRQQRHAARGASFATGEVGVGQAFQFDGSTGYVCAGNPANLRLTSAITIEAWINLHVAPTVNNMEGVVTKWAQIFNDTPDSDSYGLWIRQDSAAGLSLFGAIHQSGGSERMCCAGQFR